MNLSDGGANREPMMEIGMKGLRSVLEENGRWTSHLTRAMAEEILWNWKLVHDQLTEIEKICNERNIICLYNSKAHPWLAPIEKWWRFSKCQLEDSTSYEEMRNTYKILVRKAMKNDVEMINKCNKWFDLSLKFAEYYARGGSEIIREHEMRSLDLSSMPSPTSRYRFKNIIQLLKDSHDANWILIRGKHYRTVEDYW